MKKLTASLITAGVIAGASMSAPVMAAGPSGNVAFTNDYIFRGVTQSGNKAAVQGGLDWEKDKWSWGAWGSSISVGSEIDVYGAYNFGPVALGAIYYYYDEAGGSFYEVNVGGDAGPVALLASYTPDNAGSGTSAYYLEGSGSFPMGKASLDLHLGYGDSYSTASGGAAIDYSIAISGAAGGVDLSLGYWKSDSVSDSDGKVFVSVSKSM